MNGLVDGEVLHCIGESHCLRFSDLCWVADGRAVSTRVHFLMHVEATNFLGDGGLHPDLAAALLAAGLCKESESADGGVEITAVHRSTSFAERVLAARHAALADRPLVPPAILWFAGDKEVHSLAVALGIDADFELPGFDAPIAAGAVRFLHGDVEAALQHRLQPFFDGLEALVTAGFTRSLVHALAPRSADVRRVAQWLGGIAAPTALRTKLAVLANRLIVARCAELGLGFVDPWNDLVIDGAVDARFDLDGVHLNRAATERTFPRVVEALAALGDGGANDTQYELLAELAVHRDLGHSAPRRAFETHGFVVVPDIVDAEVMPFAPLSSRVRATIEADWEYEVGVALVASEPFDAPARLGTAARRAVRGAVAAAGGTRQVTVEDTNGTTTSVDLAPGATLVFDPARVVVRCRSELHCLLAIARLPDEAPRVVFGSGEWPADPFRIRGREGADAASVAIVLRRWREVFGKTVLLPRPAADPVAVAAS